MIFLRNKSSRRKNSLDMGAETWQCNSKRVFEKEYEVCAEEKNRKIVKVP